MEAKLRRITPSMAADGSKMRVKAILDKRAVTSKGQQIKLLNCRYGASKFNLCAITKLTNNGWKAIMDKTGIHLHNTKGQVISFDVPIPTPEGCIWAMKLVHSENPTDEL